MQEGGGWNETIGTVTDRNMVAITNHRVMNVSVVMNMEVVGVCCCAIGDGCEGCGGVGGRGDLIAGQG